MGSLEAAVEGRGQVEAQRPGVHRYHALVGPWGASVLDAASGIGCSTRGHVFCKLPAGPRGRQGQIVHASEGPKVKPATLVGAPLLCWARCPQCPHPHTHCVSHPLPPVSKAECLPRAPQLLPARVTGPGGWGAGCRASALGCRGMSAGPRTQGLTVRAVRGARWFALISPPRGGSGF